MKTRSILKYGGPPPLLPAADLVCPAESASRRRAKAALWRAAKAEGLARSKTCRITLAFGLLACAFCFPVWAQYTVDWSTIDGGGGTSTGGVYSVSGTIGQPDAGTMSGGNYTLHGGFWGLIAAVQTPGAPYLWVTRTTTNTVTVWWPVSESSWQLQATTGLVSTGSTWTVCSYTTNGANCVYVESPPTGSRFYRLQKP